ncbi:hypothetical protein JR316_0011267 [Psilocybe cubensis]|uniref:Uncharacterized protein n=2 Tax=Psilocybe cubensis TaxID=181762 RepID=A0A8H7XWJ7_PSICU|nr:hypothetical protein JR316_0011267 [Psilocybe cubensis]KAH9475708.1 hypothetical protein JR316_0011267 [Psilocybe cubensis]
MNRQPSEKATTSNQKTPRLHLHFFVGGSCLSRIKRHRISESSDTQIEKIIGAVLNHVNEMTRLIGTFPSISRGDQGALDNLPSVDHCKHIKIAEDASTRFYDLLITHPSKIYSKYRNSKWINDYKGTLEQFGLRKRLLEDLSNMSKNLKYKPGLVTIEELNTLPNIYRPLRHQFRLEVLRREDAALTVSLMENGVEMHGLLTGQIDYDSFDPTELELQVVNEDLDCETDSHIYSHRYITRFEEVNEEHVTKLTNFKFQNVFGPSDRQELVSKSGDDSVRRVESATEEQRSQGREVHNVNTKRNEALLSVADIYIRILVESCSENQGKILGTQSVPTQAAVVSISGQIDAVDRDLRNTMNMTAHPKLNTEEGQTGFAPYSQEWIFSTIKNAVFENSADREGMMLTYTYYFFTQ